MKKNKILLISLLLFMPFIIARVFAYETFDGKYTYKQGNEINGNEYSSNFTKDDEEVLFIVDFSNSMNKRLGYSPKVFHAIDAIRSILATSGREIKIGLRTFGVTDKPILIKTNNGLKFDMQVLCTATKLVLPIAKYNAEHISDRLSDIVPQGATPIDYTLRQAVQNDFSPNSKTKHIILVTDGGENCGGDPCQYIKRLMQVRNDFLIDVIGITVDENAYSQLNCIANSGRGRYFAIDSEEDFKIKFKEAFNSNIKPNSNIKTTTNTPQITQPMQQKVDTTRYRNFVFEFED